MLYSDQTYHVQAKYALTGKSLEVLENVEVVINPKMEIIDIQELSFDIEEQSILIPGFYDSHVHAADYGLRGVPSGNLNETIGPLGKKMMYLNKLDAKKLKVNLLNTNREVNITGIRAYNDFREGGLNGSLAYLDHVQLAKKLVLGKAPPYVSSLWEKYRHRLELLGDSTVGENGFDINTVIDNFVPSIQILGRPDNFEQVGELLTFSGLGIRDVRSYDLEVLLNIRKAADSVHRIFHIHAGEDPELTKAWEKETGESDVHWAINNLHPTAIIHGNLATEEDFKQMKQNEVGLVICLRSNAFTQTEFHEFNALAESGLPPQLIGLGTDNAMMHSISLWKEMKAFYDNASGFSARDILTMASLGGAKVSGFSRWGLVEGNDFTATKFFFPKLQLGSNLDLFYEDILLQGPRAGVLRL